MNRIESKGLETSKISVNIENKSILITASIAIAFYPLANTLKNLQKQADIAMGYAQNLKFARVV